VVVLGLVGLLVWGASTASAQSQSGAPQTTTTTAATTTTTKPRPTTTTTTRPAAQPTAPPTTQGTAPPATAGQSAPADNDSGDVVVTDEQPVEEAAATDVADIQAITFTTAANLLVPGDGTEGAQATTTTTTAPPDEGSSADDENRLIWMVVAGLVGVAVLVAVLTWRYWLLTRPGLVLEGDEDDVRGGTGGSHYGGATPSGRGGPAGGGGPAGRGGGPDAFWDQPRDPRRTFVGPPQAGGSPARPPGPGGPVPGSPPAGPGTEGARRRRPRPGGPGGQGGQGGRGGTPPPGRGGRPPGPSPSQSGERSPQKGDARYRRGQPGGGGAPRAKDMVPNPARRDMGRPPGGARTPPAVSPQPMGGGRTMRDTDIWAPDSRR
jgi:hypothetical protein